MKKAKYIVIIVVSISLVVIIGGGMMFVNTPEYALMKISKDVKSDGIQGLSPHLTGDAKTMVDSVVSITENKFVASILSIFDTEDKLGTLKSNLEDVEWSLKDVLKGKNDAIAVLGFNYKNQLVGTINISMIKENNSWKINDIDLPEF